MSNRQARVARQPPDPPRSYQIHMFVTARSRVQSLARTNREANDSLLRAAQIPADIHTFESVLASGAGRKRTLQGPGNPSIFYS